MFSSYKKRNTRALFLEMWVNSSNWALGSNFKVNSCYFGSQLSKIDWLRQLCLSWLTRIGIALKYAIGWMLYLWLTHYTSLEVCLSLIRYPIKFAWHQMLSCSGSLVKLWLSQHHDNSWCLHRNLLAPLPLIVTFRQVCLYDASCSLLVEPTYLLSSPWY